MCNKKDYQEYVDKFMSEFFLEKMKSAMKMFMMKITGATDDKM